MQIPLFQLQPQGIEEVYFEWKVKKIQEVINANGKKQYIDYKKQPLFKIFDDMDDYFLKLKKYSEDFSVKVTLFLIDEEKGWNYLIKEFKGRKVKKLILG